MQSIIDILHFFDIFDIYILHIMICVDFKQASSAFSIAIWRRLFHTAGEAWQKSALRKVHNCWTIL